MVYERTPQHRTGSPFGAASTADEVLAGLDLSATQVWAATSPLLAGKGGVYCEDCDVAEPALGDAAAEPRGVCPWATDPEQAARLWRLSAERTGVDAFG